VRINSNPFYARRSALSLIATNHFRVAKGSEAAFEDVWMSRDSHLEKVPGFVEFHLLTGPDAEDHTICASHTDWENRAVFEAWTKSEVLWTITAGTTAQSGHS
jgi:heme-degrading monooxygenase HmoA